jgi:hypothetical protein
MKISKARLTECKEALLQYVKPGDTIYCNLKHVSKSGMYRVIDLFVIADNQPLRLSGYAADLLEGYDNRHDGCKAHGVGMDMGYHLVAQLSYILYPDGFACTGDKCPSNEHSNPPYPPRDKYDIYHKTAGYSFHCRWM